MFTNHWIWAKRILPLIILVIMCLYAQDNRFSRGGVITLAQCRAVPESCIHRRLWFSGQVVNLQPDRFQIKQEENAPLLTIIGQDPRLQIGMTIRLVAEYDDQSIPHMIALDDLSWVRMIKLGISLIGLAFVLYLWYRSFRFGWENGTWIHPRHPLVRSPKDA